MQRKQFAWIALGFAISVGNLVADEREQVVPATPTLSWFSKLDEALVAAKKSGKPILLEFR